MTGFIDVTDHVLYWETWECESDGTGFQVSGGSIPDQGRPYF